jgi:hypothetical protein
MLTVVKPRVRKGTGLERMTKSLGTKVRIEIDEGTLRPRNPLQAAKLATEGGLIARSHTPVLPHFKEYKENKALMENYMRKVVVSSLFLVVCVFLFLLNLPCDTNPILLVCCLGRLTLRWTLIQRL